jgi:hypothetical protein
MKLSPTGIRAEERKARRNMYGIVAATQLEAMIAHAMHRVQTRWAFGVPIGEHLIQDKRVDMKVAMGSSRWLAYSKAAALIDHDPGFSVRASCTKLIASEGLVRAATCATLLSCASPAARPRCRRRTCSCP